MSTPDNKVKSILDFLFDQFSMGWLAYLCAKSLNDAYGKITCARFFFMGAFVSCINESILSLSKLLINNSESITIPYLLNYVENNPSEFYNVNVDTIRNKVIEHKAKLDGLKTFIVNIKIQRDKKLAHFDKIHLNKSTDISNIPYIDMNEVENCYRELLNILNVYRGYYDSTEYYPKIYEEEIPKDVEFLLSLMNK